ncbi:MAG: chromosome segregation protein SMC [Burkholderiales bacterium]|nr:chromosome segregation protein SMC [Nitrosomonadaceae bacterium]
MRLTQIKLAGFKSFVDPTTIAVPGQLVGVVGPNGCGKSNVIDAVRWVLGESSAKNLRGEKMEDVIFNGSSQRKPSARASVELVFDNSLGRIGGQWGQYAELSVKRVLSRDGNSDYYINGQHVRRRDITDVFLGTGLGPRAYAIIEQGMISRVITSKPEELRVFLEEVAGVSKYRERRKETEARLEDSKENLNRVDDILGELSKNVERLTEQAAVAAKYHELNTELKLNENLWAYTKQREARASKERYANEIDKAETGFEGETARLREVEAALDKLRQDHYAETDQLTTAQAAMFEANTAVVQLEQEINYLADNRRRLGAQVEALAQQLLEVEANRDATTTELDRWHRELASGIDKVAEARERAEALREEVPSYEKKVREAVAAVKLADNEVRTAESDQALNESREASALKILSQLEQRKNRLTTENMALVVPEDGEVERVQAARAELQEALAQTEEQLAAAEGRVEDLENRRRDAIDNIGHATRELARIEAALLALQNQQARMDNNNRLAMWLAKYQLDNAPRLWQSVKIKEGWEDALEAALGLRLNAMRVSDGSVIDRIATDAPPGAVALFLEDGTTGAEQKTELVGLASFVTADSPGALGFVRECLANVYVLENEADARRHMARLPFGGALVTAKGHLYSQHGVTFHGPQSELHGVLQRQREIESLKAELPSKIEARHAIEAQQKEFEIALAETQETLRQLRASMQDTKNREHALQMEALKLEQAVAQAEGRRAAIREELALIDTEIEQERGEMAAAQAALEEGGNKISEMTDKLMVLEDQQRAAESALSDARERVNAAERGAQEANYFERSCHDKIKSLTEMVAQLAKRWDALSASRTSLAAELESLQEGNIQERLQAALALRQEREKALAAARDAMDAATGKLKGLEDQRHQIEQQLQPLRDKMTELRMKEQEARINEETFTQQLLDNGGNLEELAELVEKRTRSTAYQAEINRLTQEITALGAVNLAALQELEQATVRKEFLDAQSSDLKLAVETLENAIKRIDRETRDLLQTTFETVNRNFMELFPSLFGGGNAYLRLTGDEILDAGLQVFAQPPGKKNSSIQLLSGGEKALTALSLVFSLFRLNPAPFCLLDEVDAPLDDSNTDRFCDLVKKMSASTQFLFITHNKVTMEMGEQLVGVTMNEPGCSRIVEVDIDAAKKFASSAPQAVAA